MKETGFKKEVVINYGFFTVEGLTTDYLELGLIFHENRKSDSTCPYMVFCTGEGIAGIEEISLLLSTCSGSYVYPVSPVSEDNLTNFGIVLIPVVDLAQENYYQVVVKINGKESVLGKGKFFYEQVRGI